MKFISNFSGGLCSFWATMRAIEKHGKENVIPLFADTLIEDEDLYSFNRRAEEIFGIPIIRVCHGLTPWQLFRKEGLIANTLSPICSIRLKREPLNEWAEVRYNLDKTQQSFLHPEATVILGFDWTEHHRADDFQAQHPTWRVWAPMTESPLWDKCRMMREGQALGLKTPRLYELGFPHNNCGGACVRAGISHFVHLLKVLPGKFTEWENEEQETIRDFHERGVSSAGYTILRDRRGGDTKPLSLLDLRKRVESGEKFPADEWGGCGCGGAK